VTKEPGCLPRLDKINAEWTVIKRATRVLVVVEQLAQQAATIEGLNRGTVQHAHAQRVCLPDGCCELRLGMSLQHDSRDTREAQFAGQEEAHWAGDDNDYVVRFDGRHNRHTLGFMLESNGCEMLVATGHWGWCRRVKRVCITESSRVSRAMEYLVQTSTRENGPLKF
jgi:hypothetical protein